jgi:hypothetical protein
MWLLKLRRPHYKTIANFRKDNAEAFRHTFRKFVLLLKEWDFVDGQHVAIDSFKIRAQNSLKMSDRSPIKLESISGGYRKERTARGREAQRKIDRHLDYIDDKINQYIDQLEGEDDQDKRDEIQSKIEYNAQKADNYQALSQRLEDEQVDQISTVDPDARAVVLHRNIVNVGYNVQAASDGKHKLLIAMDTGDVNDTHALAPMIERAQSNLHTPVKKVLADKGYHTGEQLHRCAALGVKTYVSPKANAATKQHDVFPMESFSYHPGTDTYRCPNNQILRTNGTLYQRKGKNRKGTWVSFKHYKTKACKTCPLRSQCTSSANGRVVQRSVYQGDIDRNNNRVNSNPDYYRERQQIIEHQFGTLKRHWGFTYVLMRGKKHVLAETSIIFSCYNLRRTVSILGFEALLDRLKGLKKVFLGFFGTICFTARHNSIAFLSELRCVTYLHVTRGSSRIV